MKRVVVAFAISVGLSLAACGGKAAPAAAPEPAASEPTEDLCCCEFIAEHGEDPTRAELMPVARCQGEEGLGECVEEAVCEEQVERDREREGVPEDF